MKISDEVYNCLINQAIVMKMDSIESSSEEIARKVVEEYLGADEASIYDRNEIISRIINILKN